MKITLVTSSLRGGGAERIAVMLADGWSSNRHQISIITLAEASEDDYGLSDAVRRTALSLIGESSNLVQGIGANLRRMQALRHALKQDRPDVVIGVMSECAVLAILALRGMGVPVIASEHIYPKALPLARHWDWLRARAYPHAARVVMLTRDGLDWLNETIPTASGCVIPNPVSYPLPATGRSLAPDALVEAGRPVILTIGRMVYQKHLDLAIDAFARIARHYPEARHVILGEGPDRPMLEAKIRDLGLVDKVLMPGWAGNLADWYERATLLLMSSRFEGFPNVILEAMAYGCPAVSVDCPTGPRDIITNGHNGLLVPMNDAARLAEAAARVLANPEERAGMSRAALDVRQRYALPAILHQWDRLFAALGLTATEPVA